MQVQVSLACATSAPTVTVSSASVARRPGVAASYAVTVTNRDSAACSASSFGLSGQVPAGWTGTASPAALTLAPGQQGSATLAVSSDPGAASGSYAVGVLATDSALIGHSGSGGATYVVDALAPSPVSTLSVTTR